LFFARRMHFASTTVAVDGVESAGGAAGATSGSGSATPRTELTDTPDGAGDAAVAAADAARVMMPMLDKVAPTKRAALGEGMRIKPRSRSRYVENPGA
jgi:hypothetical protein